MDEDEILTEEVDRSELLDLYSEDLIKALNKKYPAKVPDLNDSDRLIWFKAGQRDVVEHLLFLLRNSDSATKDK